MSPPKIEVPQPSAAETHLREQQARLLRMQTNIIKQSKKQQDILLPFFAKQAGFKVRMDKHGNIIGVHEVGYKNPDKQDPLKKQSDEIQKLLNERTLAALKGELPVDPALERDLTRQEETLRERLQSQFGAGYETSTPGIETLDEFFKTAEGLRYQARTGQLTLAEQLGLARRESDQAQQAQSINILRGSAIGDPLSFAAGAGQTAAGYGNAGVPYQRDRQMQLEANIQNVANQMSFMGGIGSLAGTVFGAVFG